MNDKKTQKKNILVTGGCGYIGSHAVAALLKSGYGVVVIDDLSNGHKEAIPEEAKLYLGSCQNNSLVKEILNNHKIIGVMHFAAFIEVAESMSNPEKYFSNNVANTLSLLETLKQHKINVFIYSSSAAVYGIPKSHPITEDSPLKPVNVYGETKAMIEKVLDWYSSTSDFRYVALRYFNAAGSDLAGERGEAHNPETHLIPLVLETSLEKRDKINVFGDDYPTPDGSCIRDYVHVDDLAQAHILALESLLQGGKSAVYNLGSSKGYSVKEIIKAAGEVTGKNIPYQIAPRRPGDPAILIASSDKIKKELKWNPAYSDIRQIIESAWNWHRSPKFPNSKGKKNEDI